MTIYQLLVQPLKAHATMLMSLGSLAAYAASGFNQSSCGTKHNGNQNYTSKKMHDSIHKTFFLFVKVFEFRKSVSGYLRLRNLSSVSHVKNLETVIRSRKQGLKPVIKVSSFCHHFLKSAEIS